MCPASRSPARSSRSAGRHPLQVGRRGDGAGSRRRLRRILRGRTNQRAARPGRPFQIEAAAIPRRSSPSGRTLFERGRLAAGETLAVHGGTSGIGTTAIQLAKAFGARVIVTAGGAAKCAACLELGADVAINYKTEDFAARLKAETAAAASTSSSTWSAATTSNELRAAAEKGAIVQIAFQRRASRGRFQRHHAEAPPSHRLDPSRPRRSRKRPRSPRRRGTRLAAPRRAARSPVIDFDLPAARARMLTRAWNRAAHRQDRADPLKRQRNIVAAASGSGYS